MTRRKHGLARLLRKELTPPEARLWLRLKGRSDGLHFRKQHPIGPYIVDFYCASARLIVEVEGQIHDVLAIADRDVARTALLESQGYLVYRIPAVEIMKAPDEIALGIISLALDRK